MPGWRGLYAIVDPDFCAGRDPRAVAEAILAGGCAVLQLRQKKVPPSQLQALAHALRELTARAGVPFVVNDHVELAKLVKADGVHLGQDDSPVAAARDRLGRGVAIGVSTHDLAQARRAHEDGADVIGFGPVFATNTKHNPDPIVGLAELRVCCASVPLPVVAIGGVTLENAPQIASTGAPMAAAISAVCGAQDPEVAAAALHAALSEPPAPDHP
jgi:thiamine-phosphate pyrophosphorylase